MPTNRVGCLLERVCSPLELLWEGRGEAAHGRGNCRWEGEGKLRRDRRRSHERPSRRAARAAVSHRSAAHDPTLKPSCWNLASVCATMAAPNFSALLAQLRAGLGALTSEDEAERQGLPRLGVGLKNALRSKEELQRQLESDPQLLG